MQGVYLATAIAYLILTGAFAFYLRRRHSSATSAIFICFASCFLSSALVWTMFFLQPWWFNGNLFGVLVLSKSILVWTTTGVLTIWMPSVMRVPNIRDMFVRLKVQEMAIADQQRLIIELRDVIRDLTRSIKKNGSGVHAKPDLAVRPPETTDRDATDGVG